MLLVKWFITLWLHESILYFVYIKFCGVVQWIKPLAHNHEIVCLKPGPGEVLGALYLSDCMGITLDHKVTFSGRDK